MTPKHVEKRIVIGVTASMSRTLLRGFPKYLADQGWDVHVVSAPPDGGEEQHASSGVSDHWIPMSRQPSPLADAKSLAAWVRLLRTLRPAIVFVGTPKASLLGITAAWLCRVPIRVYHVRGLRLETAEGLLKRILTLSEKLTFTLASSAIAVSESLKVRLHDLGLSRGCQVVVLGKGSSNGVDVASVARDAAQYRASESSHSIGLRPDLPVVGYVGRLNRDKGVDTLVGACIELTRRNCAHQLLLIGGDEGLLAEDLLERALQAGVHVVHIDHVASATPFFGAMDVFCLPTLREGFPNVVLEAAAAGLPVVTTTATGAIDSVVDGETGVLVKPGDSSEVADALQCLLVDPALRLALGAAAHARVVSEFERGAVWKLTCEYLESLQRVN